MNEMPPHVWAFPCRVDRVIDGDTIDLILDLGRRTYGHDRIRLLGVDTPEVRGPERIQGLMVTEWVRHWLMTAEYDEYDDRWPFVVQTEKDPDSFGRYLGRVYRRHDGACLNDDLLTEGYAEVYR